MGLHRDFCFAIVAEQIIISNIQLYRSLEHLVENYGDNKVYYVMHMVASLCQIIVGVILMQGLIERKAGKLIPWLAANAIFCLITIVFTIVICLDSSILSQIFQASNSIMYLVSLSIMAAQFISWFIVLLYYRHLRIKEFKSKLKRENRPADRPVTMQYPEMFDNQPQVPNVQIHHLNQQEREEMMPLNRVVYPVQNVQKLKNQQEIEDVLPLKRLYPIPTAPPE